MGAILSLLGGCGARSGLWNPLANGGESAIGATENSGGFAGQMQTAPVVQACGPNNATCLGSEYCGYPSGRCKSTADSGSCVARPIACPQRYMPVCGCDRQHYDNSCLARASGADFAENGGCIPEPTQAGDLLLLCGGLGAANPQAAYCEVSRSAVDGITDFNVHLLPPACMAQGLTDKASCDCFAKDTPCLEGCTVTRTGAYWGYTLFCAKPR